MFIEKLQFNEDTNDKTSFFYPFANDSIIEFGGEKEMQKMIGFYFKTKENSKIENINKNAKRFKINIVLGNN